MSRDVLVHGDADANRCPGVRECDVERATQLADALPHALNADSERLGQQRAVLMRRLVTKPVSLVFYVERNRVGGRCQINRGGCG